MRFERVDIVAFGPFNGKALEFASGFTLVSGPNESGKTTIHAAIYAALCGMRRGRGQPRKEDREFEEQHRPWFGDEWAVTAVIRLHDGRRIELRHDLRGRVDARATDLGLGRDVSNEIISDGSPDGSRWLGLDRRSFLTTACVRQADVLAVVYDAELIQEHLQRAADTAGADETAAKALAMIDEFRREHVGLDRANARKPLRAAIERHFGATGAVGNVREERARHDAMAAEMHELEREANHARISLALFETAVADAEARQARDLLDRARELTAQVAREDVPSEFLDEAIAQRVADALALWQGLGVRPALSGSTADELRGTLAALPTPELGDTAPDEEVVRARDLYAAAGRAIALERAHVPILSEPILIAATEHELRRLADEVDLVVEPPDARAARDDRSAQNALERVSTARALIPGVVLGLVGAAVAVIVSNVPLAVGALAIGVLTSAVMFAVALRRGSRLRQPGDDERTFGAAAQAADAVRVRRDRAVTQARDLGVDSESAHLRSLADALAEREHQVRAFDEARRRIAQLESERDGAARQLGAALSARGAVHDGDLLVATDAYITACRRREVQARAAQGRSALEHQLTSREQLEWALGEWQGRHRAAVTGLRETNELLAMPAAEPSEIVDRLRVWQQQRASASAQHEAHVRARAELETLLDGRTLEACEELAAHRAVRVEQLRRSMSGDTPTVELGAHAEAELSRLREAANSTSDRASTTRGQVELVASRLPSLAEAEESLAEAETELARVRQLKQTLDTTERFLLDAQARVHRDIAPVLARSVAKWLPRATGGRYEEVAVDPELLAVRVRPRGGEWRDADLLSQGTRELVYLLLRIALVHHLTRRGEVAPLLLDDVTVQCDTPRTERLLDLLHEMSQERQVILFTQEEDARAWGRAKLSGPRDAYIELDPGEVAA